MRSANSQGGSGGLDAAPLATPAGEQETHRRTQLQRTARANLAALICERYGIDPTGEPPNPVALGQARAEFVELAEILGLSAPDRAAPSGAPTEVVAPAATALAVPDASPPPLVVSRPPLPVADERLALPYVADAGRCPVCARNYQLTQWGRLRTHREWALGQGGQRYRLPRDCRGSGREPVE